MQLLQLGEIVKKIKAWLLFSEDNAASAVTVNQDNETLEPFFPGPPFTISGSNSMDGAVLDNPGDVAA